MPQFGRIQALVARIHTLERHAVTLQQAFMSEALKRDVGTVVDSLHQAEAWLHGVPEPDVVTQVEEAVDSIGRRLSRLGGAH